MNNAKKRRTHRETQARSTSPFAATWMLFPQGQRFNRQVGTATAGAYRAPRILINSYISGENDEKPAAQRKIDERELQQTHRSIIFIASRRKYVK